MKTIVEIIKDRSINQPLQPAVIFVNGSVDQFDQLSNAQLDSQIRETSAMLQKTINPGERVLLLMNPSKEYVITFFACLYAGIVAVPAYPMKMNRKSDRISSLLKNAKPKAIVTNAQFKDSMKGFLAEAGFSDVVLMTDGELTQASDSAAIYKDFMPTLDSIAFIQYSSGSTSTPKGVVLTHGNIAANELMIQKCFNHTTQSSMITWLPPFHDMGMIGGIMQPLYVGFPSILIPPTLFLQKPIVWLQAISKFRGTTGGAPNFAYELCTQKIIDQDLEALDLSTWKVAFNGAEPIKAKTINKFSEKFKSCGFSESAFLACYGLAEATLLVSGRHGTQKSLDVEASSLEKNEFKPTSLSGRSIVSCGTVCDGLTVRIVDPEGRNVVRDGTIGEIWIKGDSVAKGYFENEEASNGAFNAETLNGESGYLRTGDLGCFYEGELYVTGRIKDMIIIRGRNIYPHDIEAALSDLEGMRLGGIAAVGLLRDGEETLAIAVEVSSKISKDRMTALCGEIMQIITENFEVRVGAIALLSTGRMPKTSSGKIQRHVVMKGFLDNSLDVVHLWQLPQQGFNDNVTSITKETMANSVTLTSDISVDELKAWLNDYCGRRLNMRLADERRMIPPNVVLDFARKGLFGLEVPQQDGGLGLSMSKIIDLQSHLAGIDITLASLVGIHNALGLRPILRHASPLIRASILRELAEGRALGGFAITEPGAGSNPRAMTTTAKDDGEFILLNGEKKYTGLASWAKTVNVFAKHYDKDDKFLGISAFVVMTDDDGFKIGDEEVTMGIRSITRNKLYFENCRIPKSRILGKIGAGFTIAEEAMSFGRLSIAAASVGGMQRSLQMVLTYANKRDIGSGRMMENDFIRHRLTEEMYKVQLMELYLSKMGQLIDDGIEVPEEFFIVAKVAGSEFLWETLDFAMQSLGGRGYTENNRLPQYFRDGRLFRIFEGPSETLLAYLGAKTLQNTSKLEAFIDKTFNVKLNLKLRLTDFEQESAKSERKIFEQRVGELVQWTILNTVNKDNGPIKNWLNKQIKAAEDKCRRANQDKSDAMSVLALNQHLEKFKTKYGSFEQQGPREDHGLDIMFQGNGLSMKTNHQDKGQEDNLVKLIETPKTDQNVFNVSIPVTAPIAIAPQSAKIPDSSKSIKIVGPVEQQVIAWLAKSSGLNISDISLTAPISSLGIDSIVALDAVAFLENISKTRLPADLLWSVPNLREVIRYVENQMNIDEVA